MRGRYGAPAREPSEAELAFAVVLSALALGGMLFGGVLAAFAENPGLGPAAWAALKGGGLLLLLCSAAAFLLLKRGCDELDAPRLERATLLSAAGFACAAALWAGLEWPAWVRGGTIFTAQLVPALALVGLSALCCLSVVRARTGRREPAPLPPLPQGASRVREEPYVPVSVARRSGHAGAVMDADSAEWWRRINGDGSWN
jgi:hypothetical protein